uniref:Putative secreted peptide n=1 Tax=Anopheles braziliensis TaxID=58242 RepID=A0A2M3ZUI9_9DIPT
MQMCIQMCVRSFAVRFYLLLPSPSRSYSLHRMHLGTRKYFIGSVGCFGVKLHCTCLFYGPCPRFQGAFSIEFQAFPVDTLNIIHSRMLRDGSNPSTIPNRKQLTRFDKEGNTPLACTLKPRITHSGVSLCTLRLLIMKALR